MCLVNFDAPHLTPIYIVLFLYLACVHCLKHLLSHDVQTLHRWLTVCCPKQTPVMKKHTMRFWLATNHPEIWIAQAYLLSIVKWSQGDDHSDHIILHLESITLWLSHFHFLIFTSHSHFLFFTRLSARFSHPGVKRIPCPRYYHWWWIIFRNHKTIYLPLQLSLYTERAQIV